MQNNMTKLWPELNWINDKNLREKTARVWEMAIQQSELTVEELELIPFTLLIPGIQTTFMTHKRAVVHLAKVCGETINNMLGKDLSVDMDILISGAILCDVGKLLEYTYQDGKVVQSEFGKYVRHPFSGVSLAMECGLSAKVCHIIAAHANEGDLIKRSVEAYIVHHVDFMTFLPLKQKHGV